MFSLADRQPHRRPPGRPRRALGGKRQEQRHVTACAGRRAGPHTTVRLPGAFTRPNTNALSFRANDALARAVLTVLAAADDQAA